MLEDCWNRLLMLRTPLGRARNLLSSLSVCHSRNPLRMVAQHHNSFLLSSSIRIRSEFSWRRLVSQCRQIQQNLESPLQLPAALVEPVRRHRVTTRGVAEEGAALRLVDGQNTVAVQPLGHDLLLGSGEAELGVLQVPGPGDQAVALQTVQHPQQVDLMYNK